MSACLVSVIGSLYHRSLLISFPQERSLPRMPEKQLPQEDCKSVRLVPDEQLQEIWYEKESVPFVNRRNVKFLTISHQAECEKSFWSLRHEGPRQLPTQSGSSAPAKGPGAERKCSTRTMDSCCCLNIRTLSGTWRTACSRPLWNYAVQCFLKEKGRLSGSEGTLVSYIFFFFPLSLIVSQRDLDGGSHACQLPRQGVCELSIGALGGPSSSSVNDNDDDATMAWWLRKAVSLAAL